ncbi:SDR family NAD(P)-dependent oxidoreductase [Staphylococcus aureus]|nr:SDR family NAD(P)-dependent oxidoreductase [Staphylococcus aureus]
MDVTKLDSIKSAVEFIIQEEGRIDILINNAGAGFNKTTEQTTDEEINWQLNLNLMGVIRMTKAVLPIMRSQREGRVINISSVGGLVG